MSIFREFSLKIHPDVTGNTPENNKRMVEVLKYRKNEDMLLKLAIKWGVQLSNMPPVYESYKRPTKETITWLFKTFNGKIFVIKDYDFGESANVAIEHHYESKSGPIGNEANKFHFFGLRPHNDYELFGDNVNLLIRNSKIFKKVKLIKTTAKCVWVWDTDRYGIQFKRRFNITSVVGRRVDEKERWIV